MKISIITVCYNAADTIGDTIASVAAQTHPDVEHIIVDGASTDGSTAQIARLAGPDVVWSSERDRGLYDAMNKGIAKATGDVIGILNADDFYADADVLARVARCFDHDPGVEAVLGDIAFLRGSAQDRRIGRRYRSARFTPDRVAWGWMPAHPGMFVTRAVYDRVGTYRLDYRIGADFEFVARAFVSHRISYCQLPKILVLMRPGGLSTSGLKSKWVINKECLRACLENGIPSNMLMIMSKYPMKLLDMIF